MKCPYRTKKTTEFTYIDDRYKNRYASGQHSKIETHTDFEDCYEVGCPCFDLKERRCNYGKLCI